MLNQGGDQGNSFNPLQMFNTLFDYRNWMKIFYPEFWFDRLKGLVRKGTGLIHIAKLLASKYILVPILVVIVVLAVIGGIYYIEKEKYESKIRIVDTALQNVIPESYESGYNSTAGASEKQMKEIEERARSGGMKKGDVPAKAEIPMSQ